ncbi:hypothetical protein D3C86_2149540 [compost metagenome]
MTIKADGDAVRCGGVQLPRLIVAAAQTDRQVIGFPVQASGLLPCAGDPVNGLDNSVAEAVYRV